MAIAGVNVPHSSENTLPAQLFAWGMTAKQMRSVRRFLPTSGLAWVSTELDAPQGSVLLRWRDESETQEARLDGGDGARHVLNVGDGFLRSVGTADCDESLSLVIDGVGAHFDPGHPSALESLIAQPLSADQTARAESLCIAWREARVSRLNHLREHSGALPAEFVLVVDAGSRQPGYLDTYARADQTLQMIRLALSEHPGRTVVLLPSGPRSVTRLHQAVKAISGAERVQILDQPVHPVRLIECASTVYTHASNIGFEAIVWGKPVRVFGAPFYAGWGLTSDELPAPSRRKPVLKHQLVHAALVACSRYVDPETGELCDVERVVAWMGLQRAMRERFPPRVFAHGFSPWKRNLVRDFLQGSTVQFVRRLQDVPHGGTVVVWGSSPVPRDMAAIRLEDGFLRSAGLGAHLVRPLSWVQDTSGIYYDATQASDLEVMLQNTEIDGRLRSRAAALCQALTDLNLTKYNIAGEPWRRPTGAIGKRVILVPGQVESDASLAWGASEVRTNMDLLRRVRQANPNAWVIYKPHPDVVAGMRKRGVDESEARQWCNEMLLDASIGQLFGEIDEVHTMTSLAGFEALLRGRTVVCYGRPFYAGWGLTDDLSLSSNDRRSRQVDLHCLVAVVLLKYSTYVSFVTRRFMTAERALLEINMQRNNENVGRIWRVFRYCQRLGLRGWAEFIKKQ